MRGGLLHRLVVQPKRAARRDDASSSVRQLVSSAQLEDLLLRSLVEPLQSRRSLTLLPRVLRFEAHELEHASRLEAIRPRVRSSDAAHRGVLGDLDGRLDGLDRRLAEVQVGSTADGDDRRHATGDVHAPSQSVVAQVRGANLAERLSDLVARGDDGVGRGRASQSGVLVELRVLERREEERRPEADDERVGEGVEVARLQGHDVRGRVRDVGGLIPRVVDRVGKATNEKMRR